jgi:hypothetical protein
MTNQKKVKGILIQQVVLTKQSEAELLARLLEVPNGHAKAVALVEPAGHQ